MREAWYKGVKWNVVWERYGCLGLTNGINHITITEEELMEECPLDTLDYQEDEAL